MGNGDRLCIIGEEKSESNIKLIEEAKKLFESVFFVPISGIHIGLTEDFTITYRTTDLLKFDAILPRIPRYFGSYAYQLLSLFPENTFIAIKPISFLLACERFFLLTILRKRNIETINLRLTHTTEAALRILEDNGFPLIIRTPGKKTGVFVANTTEAKTIIDAFAALKQPILIEDVIKDMVSVYVSEPEVIGAVKKKTEEKDIVFSKGKIKPFKLNPEIEQLALDTAKSIEAQIARVDIATSDTPRVVNVELNPSFIAPSKVIKENLVEKIINGVYENYKAHKEKPVLMKFFEDAKSVMKDVLKGKQIMI
jgi:gamma-F420-2:alpha-L-glutamate ligase